MSVRQRFWAIFDRIMKTGFNISQVFMAFMLVVVLADVIFRLFNMPINGAVEAVELSLLQFTFLGTAWVLRNNRHVTVETAIEALRPSQQVVVKSITSILSGLTFLALTYYSIQSEIINLKTGYSYGYIGSFDIPRFPILLVVPLGSLLLSIESFRKAYRYMRSRLVSPEEIGASPNV